MSDLPTTTLLVGLAVALARAIEWLAKASMKGRNGNGAKSAGLTANEWKSEIREQVKRALDETAARRHEDLKKVFKDVLEREFLERNNSLRTLIHDEFERWRRP